jgi:hypothetical protein
MASPTPFPNPFDPQARFVLPTPQMRLRPARPQPPRLRRELAWLTWQTPPQHQTRIITNLRQTLDWRAQYCGPLEPPQKPVERTRFGLLGEALQPETTQEVCDKVNTELRETIRTLEEHQPILERNRLLAMHSVRLGQLCAELEERGADALEQIRSGLNRLWV